MLVARTVDQADSETRNQKKKRHMYKQLLSNENTLWFTSFFILYFEGSLYYIKVSFGF